MWQPQLGRDRERDRDRGQRKREKERDRDRERKRENENDYLCVVLISLSPFYAVLDTQPIERHNPP